MKEFKEAIKRHFIQTVLIYIIIYITYSFTVWEFKNPIQWIIDVPEYRNGDRFFILFGVILYFSISIVLHYENLKENINTLKEIINS